MERDIIEVLREDAGLIRPNLLTDAADAIERLTAERDEARREVCCLFESSIAYSVKTGMIGFANPEHESILKCARARGWDCFKEDGK
jgi:CHAD domain-containing protein